MPFLSPPSASVFVVVVVVVFVFLVRGRVPVPVLVFRDRRLKIALTMDFGRVSLLRDSFRANFVFQSFASRLI